MADTVGNHMTLDPLTLTANDSLRSAVDLEMSRKIRHIPVVEADGTLIGIVTDRDIKRALPSPLTSMERADYEKVLDETPIRRVMTRTPITVASTSPLVDAVRLILDKKIGGLPVVDGGMLVGIFTQSDALEVLLEKLA